MAWGMLIVAPIVYLIVVDLISAGIEARAGNDLLVYLLLVVSVAQPAAGLVVERIQFSACKRRPQAGMNLISLYFNLSIVKMAMAEAVYVFGFVTFVVTGRSLNMLYFYPIGVAWSFVYWPRREKYTQLLEKLNRP